MSPAGAVVEAVDDAKVLREQGVPGVAARKQAEDLDDAGSRLPPASTSPGPEPARRRSWAGGRTRRRIRRRRSRPARPFRRSCGPLEAEGCARRVLKTSLVTRSSASFFQPPLWTSRARERSTPAPTAAVEVQPDHEGESEDQESPRRARPSHSSRPARSSPISSVEHVVVVATVAQHAEDARTACAQLAPVLHHPGVVDDQHRPASGPT